MASSYHAYAQALETEYKKRLPIARQDNSQEALAHLDVAGELTQKGEWFGRHGVDHWAGRGLLGAPAAAAAAAAHRAVVRRAAAAEARGHRGELLRLCRICCFENRDPKRWGGHATCTGGRPAEPRDIELYSKRLGKPPKPIFEPMMFAQLLLLQKGLSAQKSYRALHAKAQSQHRFCTTSHPGPPAIPSSIHTAVARPLSASSMHMAASERTEW